MINFMINLYAIGIMIINKDKSNFILHINMLIKRQNLIAVNTQLGVIAFYIVIKDQIFLSCN
jgi:hypothetical protein